MLPTCPSLLRALHTLTVSVHGGQGPPLGSIAIFLGLGLALLPAAGRAGARGELWYGGGLWYGGQGVRSRALQCATGGCAIRPPPAALPTAFCSAQRGTHFLDLDLDDLSLSLDLDFFSPSAGSTIKQKHQQDT